MVGPAVHPNLPHTRTSPDGPGYAQFLRLPELLSLQPTPVAPDMLLFVIAHQAHELWFKAMIFELENVRAALDSERFDRAARLLHRLTRMWEMLTAQWAVLDTMLPADYLAFRGQLTGGSGFESQQFREIEFLAGLEDAGYLQRARLTPEEEDRLRRRLAQPSVRERFAAVLGRHDITDPRLLYRGGDEVAELRRLAEALIDLDQAAAAWRLRHVLMVERQIGHKPGTGGSSGTSYLRSRLHLRFFPELWEARSGL
ncbi:tryptophan 2,3-dioxygenase family protein [Nocardia sp. NPDC051787]|uniref:tryptophan 2,3-dioxygenase n=1 Tax=Nocardia sp. NPDC051787 TaxID=3155415 RepID=UPI00342B13D7